METAPNFERLTQGVVVPPAHELLQDVQQSVATWPQLAHYPEFARQISEHDGHLRAVNDVIASVSDDRLFLQDVAEADEVTSVKVQQLYIHLSELLRDPEYRRVLLYIPNNWLPHQNWQPSNNALALAVTQFKQDYMCAWYEQLSVLDVRANFVDGDVLETELQTQEPPRTVVAAHLIPVLVERGYMQLDDVYELRSSIESPEVVSSIDRVLDAMNGNSQVGCHEQADHEVTESRRLWLEQNALDAEVAKNAREMCALMVRATTSIVPVPNDSSFARQSWIEGLRMAIGKDGQQALYDLYEDTLINIDFSGDAAVRRRYEKLFRHALWRGLVDREDLAKRSIPLTTLTGPLSTNVEYMNDEVDRAQQITKDIASDADIAAYVYPVVGVGGSRLKGYGDAMADTDMCVFIKPNAYHDSVQTIREGLARIFAHNGIVDRPIEFWLKQQHDNLVVSDPMDAYAADKYWTHLLFNTLWVGRQDAVATLQQKLLQPYMLEPNTATHASVDRAMYLERLEQDLLQYRLMHKGYERHFPRVKPHLPFVDKDSVFWDEGYRRIATQLFVGSVFLPKV